MDFIFQTIKKGSLSAIAVIILQGKFARNVVV